MQYKQAPRILIEILESRDLPVEEQLKLIRIYHQADKWPKLGPFKKRSPAQVLWRLASDGQRPGPERWAALEKLLEIIESMRQAPSQSNTQERMNELLSIV